MITDYDVRAGRDGNKFRLSTPATVYAVSNKHEGDQIQNCRVRVSSAKPLSLLIKVYRRAAASLRNLLAVLLGCSQRLADCK